jgi:hypothetical protein
MDNTVKIQKTGNGYYVRVDNEYLIEPSTYVFVDDFTLINFLVKYLNMHTIRVSEIGKPRPSND